MRILKIMDGFITNSSTNTTTILLAVKKGRDLQQIFKKLGFKEELPQDFFKFKDDEGEIKWLTKGHNEKLEYLLRDFNLFINKYDDYGFADEDMDREDVDKIFWERLSQMEDMIKTLKNQAKDEIIILFYGDPVHTSFYYTKPQMYSKEDIFKIFKSENRNLIKSIIVNDIINSLDFSEDELAELGKDLKIPLKKLIFAFEENEEPEREISFYESFYRLFGSDYINALLDHIPIEDENIKYLDRSVLWNFDYIYNPRHHSYISTNYPNLITKDIFLEKIKTSVKELCFDNDIGGEYFDKTVFAIKDYLGFEDLLHFLNTTNFLELVKNKKIYYISHPYPLVFAVLEGLMSENIKNKNAAEKLHLKLMKILKIKIISGLHHDKNIELFIYNLLRAYVIRKREDLFFLFLTELPQNLILEFIKSDNRYIRNFFQKLYRKLNLL